MLQHQGAESSFLCLPLWSVLTSFMISIADNLHMITMFTKKVYLCLRFGHKVGQSFQVGFGVLLCYTLGLGLAWRPICLLVNWQLSPFSPNISTTILPHHNLSSGKLASSFLSKYQYSVSKSPPILC